MIIEGIKLTVAGMSILGIFIFLAAISLVVLARLLAPITKMDEKLSQKRMKNEVRWRREHHRNIYQRAREENPDHIAAITAAIAAHRSRS